MKISMQRIFLTVDPSIPGYCLLKTFNSSACGIRKIKTAVPLRVRHLAVDLISFAEKHQIIDAFVEIQALGGRSFLQPYDLLMLDYKRPELQMISEIITPKFTLGVDPDEVSEYLKRGHFGRVIRDTASDRMMGPKACYATMVHTTPVDRIDVDAPEGTTDYEKQMEAHLRLIYTPLLMSGTREA